MKKIILIIIALASFTLTTKSQTGSPTLRKKSFNLSEGIAINGYDPVDYFKKNKAIKGKKEFSQTVDGVVYYFENSENKATFIKSPAQYEPQYGGWCAYAMGSTGEKVEIDPATFKIVNGKLYLFYNAFFNNTKKTWDKDETTLKPKADANWDKIFK
jgi:YHS domain-containing protein